MEINYVQLHIPHSGSKHRSHSEQGGVRKEITATSATVKKQSINERIQNKPADVNFCGFFNSEKILKSNGLKKILEFAEKQQLVFGATFSLILTCIMRPASIMIFPSKKNKEDQKYASAHSIASGIIGFGISTAIFTPISSGIKKFSEKPADYIKDKNHYLLKNKKALDTAKIYLDRMPDIVTAIPKGILTIALIPPILKYVFGIEKKKSDNKNPSIPPLDYSLINFKNRDLKNSESFACFTGGQK